MRITLISKLAITTSLILIVFMIVFAWINIASMEKMLLEAAISDADKLTETIIQSTHYEMLEDNRKRVYEMIQEVGALEGIKQIRLINKSGHVSFSTRKEEIGRLIDKNAAGCSMCHASGEPKVHASTMNRSRIFLDRQGRQVLGMAKAIYNKPGCSVSACHFHPPRQRILGVIDIVVSLEKMHTLIGYYRNKIIIMTAVMLLSISLAIVFFTHRLINRPLKALLIQTRKIAAGNLDAVVENNSRDEIGELSESFNKMTENLKLARRELEAWGKNLETKVAERTSEIKQMQSKLRRSEKLASLGRLAAGITHEINNPLTGIMMYTDLALRNPRMDPSIKGDLDIVQKESRRCAKIVNGLLDFSRESIPLKKPSSLNSIMDATLDLIGRQTSFRNIEIVREYDKELPLIELDENQMKQVLINILLNAAQAMGKGGIITIRTGTDHCHHAFLIITDTGEGIAEEDIEKIFDPFFTTKEDRGTGLGLSISFGIIERHGGKIEVKSTKGKGSTFIIKMPLTPGQEELTPHNSKSSSPE